MKQLKKNKTAVPKPFQFNQTQKQKEIEEKTNIFKVSNKKIF